MSDLKICRICLRTEVKGYKFDLHQLKYYYEEVTATKVNNDDSLPQWFCYECSTILHKYHKFKEKCYIGQKMLTELLQNGPITYELLYKYEYPKELITLQPIINTDRIKNFTVNYNGIDNISKTNLTINKTNQSNNVIITTNTKEEKQLLNTTEEIYKTINNQNHSITLSEPKSPQQIIITKEKIIKLENESLKITKSKDLDVNLTSNQLNKILNEEYWKRTDFTEEEALKEFRLRAENKKYLEATYKCKDCFVFYSKKDALARHVLMRHDESIGEHECRICRARFKWKSHLRKHIAVHYTKYECLRCHQMFHQLNSAILHEQCHSGEKKKCPYCKEEFSHVTTYYSHMRRHRSGAACGACGDTFLTRAGLALHAARMHAYDAQENADDDDDDVSTFCAKCDITFETRRAYDEHLFQSAKHTDYDITENQEADIVFSKKILSKRLQEKLRQRTAKGDDTPTIKKVKKRRKVKRKHRIPTTCHQCGEQFETQRACMQHHVSAHPRTSFYSAADRHICELCGVSLAPGSVAVHRNMHTRSQVHTCHDCGKQFHSGVGLKRHMLTHTGEKPFGCPACEKRFTQSNSMKLHYRTAHLKQPYPNRYNKNTHTFQGLMMKPDDKHLELHDGTSYHSRVCTCEKDHILYYMIMTFCQACLSIHSWIGVLMYIFNITRYYMSPQISLGFILTWTVKRLIIITYFSMEIERLYDALKDIQGASSRIIADGKSTESMKIMFKNICRLNKTVFTKIHIRGCFSIDSSLPFNITIVITTYTVVFLQFALSVK